MVALALFSNKVAVKDKHCIIEHMQQCDQDLTENCADLHNKELNELVISACSRTLELLQLDMSFIMTNNPKMYSQNNSTMSLLKLVNDVAECSTALTLNTSITKNEIEMQTNSGGQ